MGGQRGGHAVEQTDGLLQTNEHSKKDVRTEMDRRRQEGLVGSGGGMDRDGQIEMKELALMEE